MISCDAFQLTDIFCFVLFSLLWQMKEFDNYLSTDDLISHHLDLLYDNMLEANLLKIIHPFR